LYGKNDVDKIYELEFPNPPIRDKWYEQIIEVCELFTDIDEDSESYEFRKSTSSARISGGSLRRSATRIGRLTRQSSRIALGYNSGGSGNSIYGTSQIGMIDIIERRERKLYPEMFKEDSEDSESSV